MQHIQEIVHEFENHIGAVTSIAWSPDGQTLVTGDGIAMVYLWDLETGYQIKSIEAYPEGGGAENIQWSPTDELIAVSVLDYKVHVWDLASDTEVFSTEEHPTRIISMDWSPDGSTIATGDDAGFLALMVANSFSQPTTSTGTRTASTSPGED